MIGDKNNLRQDYLEIAQKIWATLKEKISLSQEKIVIGIAGESGSGKTVTAFALQHILENFGYNSAVLQQDDYFKLPPKTNHNARVQNIQLVGREEVDLELIQNHINSFKNEIESLEKPLVDYNNNLILSEKLDLKNIKFLIVEGTYILSLENYDFNIFIDRNFKDTKNDRIARKRDEQSDFVEEVLEIEHQIIKNYKNKANIIIDNNYKIHFVLK